MRHCERLHSKGSLPGKLANLPCLVRVEGCPIATEGSHHRVARAQFSGRQSLQLLRTWPVRVNMHPSLFQPLEPALCGQVAAASGRCQEQLRSGNVVKTARWRAAGYTNLIIMMDLNCVGFCKQFCEAVWEHGAADAWCCRFPRPAVPLHLCSSERDELGHLIRTHDEGSARSSLHVCSHVFVRWCGMYRVSRGTRR